MAGQAMLQEMVGQGNPPTVAMPRLDAGLRAGEKML